MDKMAKYSWISNFFREFSASHILVNEPVDDRNPDCFLLQSQQSQPQEQQLLCQIQQ